MPTRAVSRPILRSVLRSVLGGIGGGGGGGGGAGPGDGPTPELVWIKADEDTAYAANDPVDPIANFASGGLASFAYVGAPGNEFVYKENVFNGLQAYQVASSGPLYSMGLFGADWGSPTEITVFVVNDSDNSDDYFGTNSSANRMHMIGSQSGATFGILGHISANGSEHALTGPKNGGDADAGVPRIDAIRHSSGIFEIYSNKGTPVTTNAGGDIDIAAATQMDIGRTHFGEWGTVGRSIAEVLVYNRALSSAEMDDIWTYLADKYGITLV